MRKRLNRELGRLNVEEFKSSKKIPLVIVLDNIRSLNNVGSVFRTADAFLIEQVYLCGITASPPHKEIHKTALGATESVNWSHESDTVSLIQRLREDGYRVLAVEQTENSTALHDFQPEYGEKYAVIFGNEVKGVQQQVVDLCHGSLEIPQYGTKHSLNISVSCGIVLWELFRKIRFTPRS